MHSGRRSASQSAKLASSTSLHTFSGLALRSKAPPYIPHHMRTLKTACYPLWYAAFAHCLVFARLVGIFQDDPAFVRKWQRHRLNAVIIVIGTAATLCLLLPVVGVLYLTTAAIFFFLQKKHG